MIKDRAQKQLAIRFCAVQNILPFTEVLIKSETSLEATNFDITDVDVMGLALEQFGTPRKYIFDCKTVNKMSAINRALWVSGLCHYVSADEGFIIQPKDISDTHRLAAVDMNVNIHTEDSFRKYANSLNIDFSKDITYLDDLDSWDKIINIKKTYPKLYDLSYYSNTVIPLEKSSPRAVRRILKNMGKSRLELDPNVNIHMALYCIILSGFIFHSTLIVSRFKDIFNFSITKDVFEDRLRYFLWEGKENYDLRLKLRQALQASYGDTDYEKIEFDLPNWKELLELYRSFLEAPEALLTLALNTKEIAFRFLAKQHKTYADQRLHDAFKTNKRARQFIFSASRYLSGAYNLPQDVNKKIENQINDIVADNEKLTLL